MPSPPKNSSLFSLERVTFSSDSLDKMLPTLLDRWEESRKTLDERAQKAQTSWTSAESKKALLLLQQGWLPTPHEQE
jgi:cytolysin (calcineurin-like family phosphatase)